MFSLSGFGVVSRRPVAAAAGFRFVLFLSFGRELVMELLVAVMNELLAAFKNGVGNARRMRCEVGMALVGGIA